MKKLILFSILLCSSLIYGAMINLGDIQRIPSRAGDTTETGQAFGNTAIDADFEKIGWIFQYLSTQSIKQIISVSATVTTGGDLDVRVETVGNGSDGVSRGVPTDTLYCANSSVTLTVNAVQDNNPIPSGDFINTNCTPVMGDYVAIIMNRPAGGTFNGLWNVRVNTFSEDFPYLVSSNTTSGWTKQSPVPNFNIQLADGSFYQPLGTLGYHNIISTSTTNTMKYVGNKFIPLFKCRVVGFQANIDIETPMRIGMYVGANEVTSITISTANRFNTASTNVRFLFPYPPVDGQTVEAQSSFRILLSTAQTVGTASSMWVFESTSASFANNLYEQTYPMGANIVETKAKLSISSESDFIDDTKRRVALWYLIDQIDLNSYQNTIKNSQIRNSSIK